MSYFFHLQIDYDNMYNNIRSLTLERWGFVSPEESVASSAVKTARDVQAKLVSSILFSLFFRI